MQTLFIICIILLGFSLIMADLLFIPGGVVAAIGGAFIIGALVASWKLLGPSATQWLILGSLVLAAILTFISIKLKVWTLFVSKAKDDENKAAGFTSHPVDFTAGALIGKKGVALTTLRPAGAVLVEGKKYDAVTEGGFIEEGGAVVITGESTGQLKVKEDRSL